MSFCESSGRIANSTRFRSTAAVFGVLMLSAIATTESWAQSTVVIGGSGQPAVEVNLDVLDRAEGQYPGAGRRLLMPGERPADVVRLRAPGSSVRSPSVASSPRLKLRRPATRPVQQATKPMPASPTPMVTQRVVSAPTPTQPVARATPLTPPPRPAPMAPPAVVEKPISPPAKATAPRQIATRSVPSKTHATTSGRKGTSTATRCEITVPTSATTIDREGTTPAPASRRKGTSATDSRESAATACCGSSSTSFTEGASCTNRPSPAEPFATFNTVETRGAPGRCPAPRVIAA